MKKILKELMTPPWLEKELPITEETVRPLIDMYWDFFELDHNDQGKEALIKFLVEFGKERPKYNLKTIEPISWAFINGFDNGYAAGHQKALAAWEAVAAENTRS